jgi:hypothetical protein
MGGMLGAIGSMFGSVGGGAAGTAAGATAAGGSASVINPSTISGLLGVLSSFNNSNNSNNSNNNDSGAGGTPPEDGGRWSELVGPTPVTQPVAQPSQLGTTPSIQGQGTNLGELIKSPAFAMMLSSLGGAMFPRGSIGNQTGQVISQMAQGVQVNALMKKMLGPYLGQGGQSGLSDSPTLTSLDVLGLPPEAIGAIYAGSAKLMENAKDRELKALGLVPHLASMESDIAAKQAGTEATKEKTRAIKRQTDMATDLVKNADQLKGGPLEPYIPFFKAGMEIDKVPNLMHYMTMDLQKVIGKELTEKGKLSPETERAIRLMHTSYQIGNNQGSDAVKVGVQDRAENAAFVHHLPELKASYIKSLGNNADAAKKFNDLQVMLGSPDPLASNAARNALMASASDELRAEMANTANYYVKGRATSNEPFLPPPPRRTPAPAPAKPKAEGGGNKVTQEQAIKQIVANYVKEYKAKPPEEYVVKKLKDMGFDLSGGK